MPGVSGGPGGSVGIKRRDARQAAVVHLLSSSCGDVDDFSRYY